MIKNQKHLKQIGVYSVVILLILAAFFIFTMENRERITDQNMEYIKDSTVQIAERADAVLSEGYDNVRILSAFLSHSLDSPQVDVEQLRKLAGNSVFDFIEFADKDGMDHNITGGVSDARDRQYYLEGMKGNDGLEVIFNSRATHETLLMFYSPVFYEQEAVGVMIGVFQASNRLTRLLQANYFGEEAELYLCTPEGRIMASSLPLDTREDIRISDLAEDDTGLASRMDEAIQNGNGLAFTLGGHKGGGYMAKLPENGWFLAQVFPEAATDAMVNEANAAGIKLEVFLLTVFGSVLLLLIMFYKKERQEIEDVAEERGKYKNAVLADALIVFEANLTKNLILEGVWKGRDGKPVPIETLLGLSLPCSYDDYIRCWVGRYVEEGSRKLFLKNTARDYLNSAFSQGKSEISFDYNATSLDGEKMFARRSIYLAQDKKTKDVIAYSNVKDITEQRRSEGQRQQYERMLLTTASGIYKGVRQIDLSDFSTIYLSFENNRIRTMDKGEWHTWLKGQIHYVHPDDTEKLLACLDGEQLLRFPAGGTLRCDFRSSVKNENGFYRVFSVTAFKSEMGGKMYIHLVTMEHTETVENEMRQKALIEDALLRAENASKAKTDFLSNMSHDIRTPMNAIIGFTALASAHTGEPELVQNYLKKISSSSNHLLSLINDVLDMSRIESGRVHLKETGCSLEEVLQELANMLAPGMNSKHQNFSLDTTELMHGDVICDKLRLNQILMNILGNAMKFTEPDGSISVRVTEKPDDREGWAVYEFHVKDTGIGISEEFQKRIFEPFEREQSSTVSGIQGTGLGMTITKNLVELMGGSIAVASKKGEGTEFTMRIPMKKDSQKTRDDAAGKREKPPVLARENGAERRTAIKGQRILLVEDNDLNREIARELLGSAGLQVEEATDGKEAVEVLLEKGAGYYSLVLMDIQMPVMDGYEATRQIRTFENRKLAEIPIIAMTANVFEEDQKRVIEMEMDAYIPKPIDVEKMLDVLDEILRRTAV